MWTWTTQGFRPSPPYVPDGEFAPFAVDTWSSRASCASRSASPRAIPRGCRSGCRCASSPSTTPASCRNRARRGDNERNRGRDRRRGRLSVRPPRGRERPRDGRRGGAARACGRSIPWDAVEFAYGGSEDAGNADTMVSDLGPTGVPFINVKNGCATGARRSSRRSRRCAAAATTSGSSSDSTSTPRAPSSASPRTGRCRTGTAGRADDHDPVLRREAAAVHARPRHPRRDPRPGGREGVREQVDHAARVAAPAALGR